MAESQNIEWKESWRDEYNVQRVEQKKYPR